MDHEREICCLNNDYLLYLANMKRGKYNSFVTQHEKVNGWESEAEFTLRKFTTISWVRNNITQSQDRTVKAVHTKLCLIEKQRKSLLWAGFSNSQHRDGVWGARCVSGVMCWLEAGAAGLGRKRSSSYPADLLMLRLHHGCSGGSIALRVASCCHWPPLPQLCCWMWDASRWDCPLQLQ